jgi:hypothetical protein
MIEIKTVPYKFKKDDIVDVKGVLKTGKGTIIMAYYPTCQPKRELSYNCKYGEPFPQVGVLFEDGEKIHYNADDLIAGKIKISTDGLNPPLTLGEFLDKLTIDMEFEGIGVVTLSSLCNKRIQKLLSSLLTTKFYSNEFEGIVLGEFDSFEYEFKSVSVGSMMRNSGEHSVIVYIKVDGYNPTTVRIITGEIF